jgi:hypothetical protein
MLLFLASLVAASAVAQSAPLPAGSAHYIIVQDKKTVGTTDCDITALSSGYQINSRGETEKYQYSFTNSNKLDTGLNIVRDQLSGKVKGSAVTFNMAADSTGRQFSVSINAGGKTTSASFDRHQHTVLLSDLDAAAYIEMAHFALQNPQTSWVVIPKGEGTLVPSDYEQQPDAQGSWNGKTVSVHHTSVVVSSENGITVEIYYTNDGTLLEADLPEQNFWIIRDGFDLQNRPKYQPPHGNAPPAQGQQQQQQQQQQGAPQYQAPQGGYPQTQPQ